MLLAGVCTFGDESKYSPLAPVESELKLSIVSSFGINPLDNLCLIEGLPLGWERSSTLECGSGLLM